ncbi:MAG TPA: ATP-binding protein [Chryseosolibacter sp.]
MKKTIAIGICVAAAFTGFSCASVGRPATASDANLAVYTALAIVIALVVLVLIQVRERKSVARQLRQSWLEYEDLFNHSPCGYHRIDRAGYFVGINKTLLGWLGYERAEVLGKLKFYDIVDPADRPAVEKVVAGADKTDSPKGKFTLLKKNGEQFPVILTVINDPDRVIYCSIDNSECKEAMDRISNLDQELEGFSYSISHDLRAPLRSIDGYSRILQEDYGSKLDAEGKRVLTVIMSNAKRMGKLIDDLLDFSRLGRKEIQPSRIDMTRLVNNIAQELVGQEEGRQIELKVDELHPAVADADMMRLVWHNLLENAVKYTGKKDKAVIEVRSLETNNREICYQVSDNGVGFDMKYAPKLFGVFQRLHKIQDFSGTGVGLAIVKRIVSRHGGRVWTEAGLDQGAVFYFTIPIAQPNA